MFFTQGNFGTYPTVFTSYYVTIFYLIFNSFSHSINKLLFVLEDSKKTILSDIRRQKTHKYSQRIYTKNYTKNFVCIISKFCLEKLLWSFTDEESKP